MKINKQKIKERLKYLDDVLFVPETGRTTFYNEKELNNERMILQIMLDYID